MNLGLDSFPKALGDLLLWLVPVGVGFEYWGDESDIPRGYILAYGQDIAPQKYPKLWKKWTRGGTTHLYGAGSASNYTKAPDKRGRVSVGKDNMGGAAASRVTTGGSGIDGATIGSAGGAETVALSIAQLASHNHNELGGGTGKGGSPVLGVGVAGAALNAATLNVTGSTGSGTAHQNMAPSIVCNYIIRAG